MNVGVPINVPLLPIQLIEALALVLIFAACLVVFIKGKREYHLPLFVYLISYSIVRFAIEFFRGDAQRGKLLLLSTSQWISIVILVFTLLFLAFKTKKRSEKTK